MQCQFRLLKALMFISLSFFMFDLLELLNFSTLFNSMSSTYFSVLIIPGDYSL